METLEEFREKIFKAMNHKPSFYRNGQFVFNHIEFEYGVADAVRIEDGIDCFYDDSKIDEFIECSYKRLNSEEKMRLNEYQKKAMTTCMASSEKESRRNQYGGLVGSYFPEEVYNYEEEDDKLMMFVQMLKDRGYYIGSDNHIRSKKGTLASKLMRNGYYMTSAQYDNKIYYFMEHRVIWVWHNGAIPNGLVINHKDYNRANNDITNLELMTQKENIEYSRCNINPPRGEKNGKAKLSNKQVDAIKTLGITCGWSPTQIEALTGVKDYNITRIVKGQRYPDSVSKESILEVYPTIVNFTRNKEIGEFDELKNYLLGLNGECGELTDIFKKVLYHGKEYDSIDVMLELGDILYYFTAICNILGIDLTEIMLNNNAKLMARYKDGYSIEQSLNRIEEQAVGTIDGNGDGIIRSK